MAAMRAARSLLLLLCSGAALAQPGDPCLDAYNAEVIRIERDLRRQSSDGSAAAKQRIARMIDAQVKLAASRARQCQGERDTIRPVAGVRGSIESDCNAAAAPRVADLNRRYAGRRLEEAEQRRYDEEQSRLKAGIRECIERGH